MERIHTIGRRKTSVARIYLIPGNGQATVNGRDVKNYFPTTSLQYIVNQAFLLSDSIDKYDLNANVNGGGVKGQAEAIKLALARALVQVNPEYRTIFKANGLMTRDPRMVERKKPGQKKARKKFQFSKR